MDIICKVVATSVVYVPNRERRTLSCHSFKNFNQKVLAMTIDELRKFPNCGHYTDEEAKDIVRTLDKLAKIIFDYTCKEYGIVVDKPIGISEEENGLNNLNIAA